MKYLLDTHVILWMASEPSKLSENVKSILLSDAVKCVSIASAWEIAIKLLKGKEILDIQGGLEGFYKIIDANNFFSLSVRRFYLNGLLTLPQIHKDPFDRLIISTAMAEGLTIITADENIHKYDVPWVW